jgi:hypothetical protein
MSDWAAIKFLAATARGAVRRRTEIFATRIVTAIEH